MNRSIETIRYTLKQFDREHPDLAVFPENRGPLGVEAKRKIFQQYHRGDSVEELVQAILPHADEHLPRHRRDARPADRGTAAGLHSQRRLRESPFAAPRAEGHRSAAGKRTAGEEIAASQRIAAVSGEFVRSAAADAQAGSASVPQDELFEVQGGEIADQARSPTGPRAA